MALPPPITITDAAADQIRELLANRRKDSVGIKVGVKSGGCSGLSYTVEYADSIEKFDEVVSYPDVKREQFKVLIDPKAVMYLIGSYMDYKEEEMQSGFVFENPNEKGRCGCGESFHV